MKRFFNWQMTLAVILILLSAFFYFLHYLIFRDVHHIFLYLIGDIAFLFINVLIVMLFLQRLLVYREKQSILKRLNMVIGTFFSEVGTDMLGKCCLFDTDLSDPSRHLIIKADCSDKQFLQMRKSVEGQKMGVDSHRGNLNDMKTFLVGKRQFLLSLLDNPNLLEHETFTDMLWAVFHLTDELAHRKDLNALPENDYQHLSGDIKRAYQQLIVQWLEYMKHLKHDYPYLFSLAMRTNPFDPNASVEVK
jgi:hypothetical protein